MKNKKHTRFQKVSDVSMVFWESRVEQKRITHSNTLLNTMIRIRLFCYIVSTLTPNLVVFNIVKELNSFSSVW